MNKTSRSSLQKKKNPDLSLSVSQKNPGKIWNTNFEKKNVDIKISISLLFYEPNTSTMFTEKSVTICKQPKYHTHLHKQFAGSFHAVALLVPAPPSTQNKSHFQAKSLATNHIFES